MGKPGLYVARRQGRMDLFTEDRITIKVHCLKDAPRELNRGHLQAVKAIVQSGVHLMGLSRDEFRGLTAVPSKADGLCGLLEKDPYGLIDALMFFRGAKPLPEFLL